MKKKVYLAVDFNNEQYCIGFYTSKYASTHFSALAKHLGIDVKDFTLLTTDKIKDIKTLEKKIFELYISDYKLLNSRDKVMAYIHCQCIKENTFLLNIVRSLYFNKIDISDIDGVSNIDYVNSKIDYVNSKDELIEKAKDELKKI